MRWALCLLCACSAQEKTGVALNVHFSTSLDQLLLNGSDNGAPAFTPGVLPDTPRALNPNGESAIIYLPAALAGKNIVVRVDGMRDGAVAASGAVSVVIVLDHILDAAVTLGAPIVCGDGVMTPPVEACDDGNKTSDDGCSADCEIENDYVCSGTPSVCLPLCGGGPPCTNGLHCANAVCVCDAESCADGCCNANGCQNASAASCGSGGAVCFACGAGETCSAGKCTCDPATCKGCCNGDACVVLASETDEQCGDNGAACGTCKGMTNTCNNGACIKASGPP